MSGYYRRRNNRLCFNRLCGDVGFFAVGFEFQGLTWVDAIGFVYAVDLGKKLVIHVVFEANGVQGVASLDFVLVFVFLVLNPLGDSFVIAALAVVFGVDFIDFGGSSFAATGG